MLTDYCCIRDDLKKEEGYGRGKTTMLSYWLLKADSVF